MKFAAPLPSAKDNSNKRNMGALKVKGGSATDYISADVSLNAVMIVPFKSVQVYKAKAPANILIFDLLSPLVQAAAAALIVVCDIMRNEVLLMMDSVLA